MCLPFLIFQSLEFDNSFTLLFPRHSCKVFNCGDWNFNININKNCEKYLQGISFSQLTLAEKAGIINLSHATPHLVISQSSYRIQTYVKKI
jgi:hypothetical protein